MSFAVDRGRRSAVKKGLRSRAGAQVRVVYTGAAVSDASSLNDPSYRLQIGSCAVGYSLASLSAGVGIAQDLRTVVADAGTRQILNASFAREQLPVKHSAVSMMKKENNDRNAPCLFVQPGPRC